MKPVLFAILWALAANARYAHAAAAPDLRIGTYNVFIGSRDLVQTMSVIRGMNADVVVLQEVSPRSAAILNKGLEREYPHRYFSSGLGIVSRFPLKNPRFRRSQYGINGFLFTGIRYPQGLVQIANMHLDPLRIWTLRDKLTLSLQINRQGKIQRAELTQVFANLNRSVPTILLGDFNRGSNAVLRELRHRGFIDSFAAVTPRPDRIPTLHYSILGFPCGRRIDLIFHDRTFQTVRSQVCAGPPSDHDALVSTLHRKRRSPSESSGTSVVNPAP